MKKRILILVPLIFILWVLPALSTSFEHFDILSETILTDFPEDGNHPGLYMANGYIGVLSKFSDITRMNKFHLFDSSGQEIFAVESKAGQLFYRASMGQNSSNIGINSTHRYGSGEFLSYYYDYFGNLLFPPIDDFTVLFSSPGLKYFHCGNNIHDGGTRPKIYDSTGNLIAILETDIFYWKLKAINDSILLFQEGNKLKLLSVPELLVKRELIIENIEESQSNGPNTALSPDGNYYAFSGKSKIAICDLKTGSVNYIDWNSTKPNFILSKDAQYLICYDLNGLHLSVFEYTGDKYEQIINNIVMKPNGSISIPHGSPYLSGDYCIINYYYWGSDPGEYRCCMFQFKGEKLGIIKQIAFDGYLKPVELSDNKNFYLIKPYSEENKNSMLYKVRFKEIIK